MVSALSLWASTAVVAHQVMLSICPTRTASATCTTTPANAMLVGWIAQDVPMVIALVNPEEMFHEHFSFNNFTASIL